MSHQFGKAFFLVGYYFKTVIDVVGSCLDSHMSKLRAFGIWNLKTVWQKCAKFLEKTINTFYICNCSRRCEAVAKSWPAPWAINVHISGDTPPRCSWRTGSPITGQCAVPAPRGSTRKGVIFNYLSLSNLAVRYGLKIIDNSTYIVGIYRPAVIGRLYTFHGVGLLSYPSHR